jgi:predicted nucleic acid-binding protein
MLVIDATIGLRASAARDGFGELAAESLVAPPLMWSEARSVLPKLAGRGELATADARATLDRLESAPVVRRNPRRLGPEAWRPADEFGWAKTYDGRVRGPRPASWMPSPDT